MADIRINATAKDIENMANRKVDKIAVEGSENLITSGAVYNTESRVRNIKDNILNINNSDGGFAAGENATAGSGAAIGSYASSESGGVALGDDTHTQSGVAVGFMANSGSGIAIGREAVSQADGAIQVGTGVNNKPNTLQVRNYELLDAEGNIPQDRLKNAGGGAVDQIFNEKSKNAVSAPALTPIFAPSIKNTASGSVIAVNDVADFEQIVPTKVESANIVQLPYYSTDGVYSDVTFATDANGIIAVSGTQGTDAINFSFANGISLLKGTWTISGLNSLKTSNIVRVYVRDVTGAKTIAQLRNDENSSTFTVDADLKNVNVYMLAVTQGTTFSGEIKLKLQKGTVATPYTPYIPDLTQARLSVGGKNILNPSLQTTTDHGVTCTRNLNGTYSFKGTATETSFFYVQENVQLSKGTYTLSGCPKGGGTSTYTLYTSGGYDTGMGKVLEIAENGAYNFLILIGSGVNTDGFVFKPQLEFGNTMSEFEPYKPIQTYTPTENGTVPNVKAVSPNMTAFGEGLHIETQYLADTKRYIDNKIQQAINPTNQAVLSLGGNV